MASISAIDCARQPFFLFDLLFRGLLVINRQTTDYFREESTSAGNQNTYDLRTLPDSHYAHYSEHARVTTG